MVLNLLRQKSRSFLLFRQYCKKESVSPEPWCHINKMERKQDQILHKAVQKNALAVVEVGQIDEQHYGIG